MQELEETFLEEYQGAREQLEKGRHKNALILFSKSLFALCDIILYHKLKKLPKNHNERFRMLEEFFPEVYLIVDELFGLYTDAYSKPILKEASQKIQNGIKQIITLVEIPKPIKEIVK